MYRHIVNVITKQKVFKETRLLYTDCVLILSEQVEEECSSKVQQTPVLAINNSTTSAIQKTIQRTLLKIYKTGMIASLFVQSLALVAVIFFGLSFHAKTRQGILMINTLSLLMWMIHFWLLGAWTGTFLIGLNIILSVLLLFKERQAWIRSMFFVFATVILLFTATLLTWEGWHSLFALCGIVSIIMAKWQDHPDKIRKFAVIASLAWIVYDLCIGSWGGITSETLIVGAIIFSLRKRKS